MAEKYDIVVGIPSLNEASTIGHVTEVVGAGLKRYFSDRSAVIVNCDNASKDGTHEAFLSADTPIDRKYLATSEGFKGKGNNLLNLFQYCEDVGAEIGMVFEADLRSIRPEWVHYLGYPIQEGYDLVTPIYSCHHFDGAITDHLCYPLILALTGYDIRQPIGGDIAFSSNLRRHWMSLDWSDAARNYGADIFLTLNTLLSDFRLCQAGLGAKVHNASTPKLGEMFNEVLFTLFSILIENRQAWMEFSIDCPPETLWQNFIRTTTVTGEKRLPEPQWVDLNIPKLKSDCRKEFVRCQELAQKYLSLYAFQKINDMVTRDFYRMDIMLWSQIVYSLLYQFDQSKDSVRKDIVRVLKPLYLMRSLAFDYQTWRNSVLFIEEEVKNQALGFLSQKPFLLGLYLSGARPTVRN